MLKAEWPSVREAVIAMGIEPARVDAYLRGRLLNVTARGLYRIGRWFKSERSRWVDDLIANFSACRSRNELETCYFAYREDPRRHPSVIVKRLLQPNRRRLLRLYEQIRGEAEAAAGRSARAQD
jgi:hypothetical protein